MKESYKVRPSQSPWPRVMRSVGQPAGRSVHLSNTSDPGEGYGNGADADSTGPGGGGEKSR